MADFQIGEAISFGWKTTTSNFAFFVKLLLVLFVVQLAVNVLSALTAFLAPVVAIVVQTILTMGLITIALGLVDGKEPEVKDLWGTYRPFWRYLGAAILSSLGVMVGLVLLVVPGVILALGWQFFSYLVVDKNLGVVESLKRSWEITTGQRWQLLGLLISLWLINLVGMLLLGIGLLWTIPTTIMAMAYVYRKLENEAPVATADTSEVVLAESDKTDLPK